MFEFFLELAVGLVEITVDLATGPKSKRRWLFALLGALWIACALVAGVLWEQGRSLLQAPLGIVFVVAWILAVCVLAVVTGVSVGTWLNRRSDARAEKARSFVARHKHRKHNA